MTTELRNQEYKTAEAPDMETESAGFGGDEPVVPSRRATASKKRRKNRKRLIIFLVIVAVAVAAIIGLRSIGARRANIASTYTTATVTRRDITETLSGSGSLEPADSYTVSTLNEGEILTADFEEGDNVEKGTTLYAIDSSDAASSKERAELALSQAQTVYQRKLESQNDLYIKSSAAGSVTDIAVETGDNVTAGQIIATIIDNSKMTVVLPFPADDAASFYVGQSAAVTLDGSFETLNGTVSKISGTDTILTGNIIVRQVTIEVNNPGALTTAQAATATVDGAACSSSGTFTYKDDVTVTADISGKVSQIYVSEGSWVSKNQTIVILSSDNLADEIQNAYNSMRDAEISLESQSEQIESYIITSPIKGTIIEKNYKEGDTLESGKTLCTIYDLTYLTVTLAVDELDIKSIEVGQTVKVTADAVPDKVFDAVVTKINIKGTVSTGVTTYPVTIRIDETEGLLPGMNVNADIVITERKDVLSVPADAVLRGNRILVQTGQPNEENENSGIPVGFNFKDVVIGASDEHYVEIEEGLTEGDMIAYIEATALGSSIMDSFVMQNNESEFESRPAGGAAPAAAGGRPSGTGE